MQTLTINIKEDFINFVDNSNHNISIANSKAAIDAYFTDRNIMLHEIKDDIDSGKLKTITHQELWSNIH